MNILALILLAFGAFAAQYFFTFIQMRSFSKHYGRLRAKGRVAIGRKKGCFHAGAIALLAIDGEGRIMEASYMQGVTVLARFKSLKPGLEGKDMGTITQEDCKAMHLAKPLTKAILDATQNYCIIQGGGEVPTPKSPLGQVMGLFSGLFQKEKTGTIL